MSGNGRRKKDRYVVDFAEDLQEECNEIVANVLKQVLGQEEYALHLAAKQMQEAANWKAVVEELAVEEWRRKVAKA